jgi:hypothetical protein
MPTKGSGSGKNSTPLAAPFRYEHGDLTLTLHVQPGAARTGWAGRYGEQALRLRLAAPAVDGRANAACCAWLARSCGVPKGNVQILHGLASRHKVVRISQVSPQHFQALQQAWNS